MRRFPRSLPMRRWLAFAAILAATPVAAASPPKPLHDLVRADKATLDSLYAGGTVGPVPTGFLPGRAIVSPGSTLTVPASRLTR